MHFRLKRTECHQPGGVHLQHKDLRMCPVGAQDNGVQLRGHIERRHGVLVLRRQVGTWHQPRQAGAQPAKVWLRLCGGGGARDAARPGDLARAVEAGQVGDKFPFLYRFFFTEWPAWSRKRFC